MTYDQAIKVFGTYRNLAQTIGVAATTVHSWRARGIPKARQYQLAVVSGGKLKAPK
jgi:hypothetical protein